MKAIVKIDLRAIVIAAILAQSSITANAWDGCGHKTVAAYALAHLQPGTKAKVEAVFAADPRGRHFIDAATWPDDIKMGLRNDLEVKAPLNKPWHFVDIPYDASNSDIETEINKPGVVVEPKPRTG